MMILNNFLDHHSGFALSLCVNPNNAYMYLIKSIRYRWKKWTALLGRRIQESISIYFIFTNRKICALHTERNHNKRFKYF